MRRKEIQALGEGGGEGGSAEGGGGEGLGGGREGAGEVEDEQVSSAADSTVKDAQHSANDAFSAIPDELVQLILIRLPLRDIGRCRQVCRRLQCICNTPMFDSWTRNGDLWYTTEPLGGEVAVSDYVHSLFNGATETELVYRSLASENVDHAVILNDSRSSGLTIIVNDLVAKWKKFVEKAGLVREWGRLEPDHLVSLLVHAVTKHESLNLLGAPELYQQPWRDLKSAFLADLQPLSKCPLERVTARIKRPSQVDLSQPRSAASGGEGGANVRSIYFFNQAPAASLAPATRAWIKEIRIRRSPLLYRWTTGAIAISIPRCCNAEELREPDLPNLLCQESTELDGVKSVEELQSRIAQGRLPPTIAEGRTGPENGGCRYFEFEPAGCASMSVLEPVLWALFDAPVLADEPVFDAPDDSCGSCSGSGPNNEVMSLRELKMIDPDEAQIRLLMPRRALVGIVKLISAQEREDSFESGSPYISCTYVRFCGSSIAPVSGCHLVKDFFPSH